MPLKIFRILCIALIIVATVWIGETLGPRRVEADVYRIFRTAVNSVADLLQGEAHPGGPRIVVINGQRIVAEIRRVSQPPGQVLDVLERYSHVQAGKTRSEDAQQIPLDEAISRRTAAAIERPFRLQGPGWGIIGKLDGDTSRGDEGLLQTMATSGYFVLALEAEQGMSSDVWLLRLGPKFDLLAMLGSPGEDSPGIDLPGIVRFPGSRRVYSLSELSQFSEAHILAYEGPGSIAEHVGYFDELFRELGLRALRGSRASVTELSSAHREYSGMGQEVAVFTTTSSDKAGEVLDVIQVRLPARGN